MTSLSKGLGLYFIPHTGNDLLHFTMGHNNLKCFIVVFDKEELDQDEFTLYAGTVVDMVFNFCTIVYVVHMVNKYLVYSFGATFDPVTIILGLVLSGLLLLLHCILVGCE